MRLITIALLISLNALAQPDFLSIKGTVNDKRSGDPIPFASVYLKGKSIGTITNNNGRFVFYVPSGSAADTLIVSCIGYDPFRGGVRGMIGKENEIPLAQSITQLNDLKVQSSRMDLSAAAVVKKAVARIPDNYPTKPFAIEGFFRDLQIENEKPVELLEAAVRFQYKDYAPGFEQAEIIEVRRAHNYRHPVNGTYDRQNAIVDLMEDNYVKHRFGPIRPKGWKFSIDSVTIYDGRPVYKISGIRSRSETTVLHIDADNFSILKLELTRSMVNGEPYKRYLNLPDPYGLQETSFKVIFEYQEFEGKMYLKYQREEDTYNLFLKATNAIVLKQDFIKELYVNLVITDPSGVRSPPMNIQESVERQARPFNPEFWKHYNAPVETERQSSIVKQLQNMELKTTN